jgi:hypothetical protein
MFHMAVLTSGITPEHFTKWLKTSSGWTGHVLDFLGPCGTCGRRNSRNLAGEHEWPCSLVIMRYL